MAAFQIAGGALLFLLAVDMVLARQSGLRSTTVAEQKEAERRKDIAVFPLAVPLIAGPGALTTVLLMVGEQGGDSLVITTVLVVLFAVLVLTLLALYFSSYIMRFLGATGANVISRVLGVVLAALAVQFMLDGWALSVTPLEEETSEILTI
jgi:multiple antibiotic resistance protein